MALIASETVWVDGMMFKIDPNLATKEMNAHLIRVENTLIARHVVIPELVNSARVVSIQPEAFCQCDIIKTVSMPNSIRVLGYRAFYNCTNLEELTVYPSGAPTASFTIGIQALYRCKELRRIECPRMVQVNICENGCYQCASLEAIDGLIYSLAPGALQDCVKINNLTFYDNVFWKTKALIGCKALKNVAFYGKISDDMPKTNLQLIRRMKIVCTPKFNYLDWIYEGSHIAIADLT